MRATNREVPCDWRLVKMTLKGYCDESWINETKIEDCGIFYLVDASLHVHICSFTPSLEGWAILPYATFTEEVEDGVPTDVEQEMMAGEDDVNYFGTEILDQCPHRPLSDYIDIPEQEEGEEDEAYRRRVADEAREYLCGNPYWF